MKIEKVMKQFYQESIDSIREQPFPEVKVDRESGRSLEDILGWALTVAYGLFYFLGGQWGEIGSYLSFSPTLF